MIITTIILATSLHTGTTHASECPMKPMPVPVASIAKNRFVQSQVNTPDRLSSSILFKDGTMVKVVNSGCDKSGGKLMAWIKAENSQADTRHWMQEALKYARVAFHADIAKDLEAAINQAKFVVREGPESIFYATAKSSEFLMFTVAVKPTDEGVILSVSYVLG